MNRLPSKLIYQNKEYDFLINHNKLLIYKQNFAHVYSANESEKMLIVVDLGDKPDNERLYVLFQFDSYGDWDGHGYINLMDLEDKSRFATPIYD